MFPSRRLPVPAEARKALFRASRMASSETPGVFSACSGSSISMSSWATIPWPCPCCPFQFGQQRMVFTGQFAGKTGGNLSGFAPGLDIHIAAQGVAQRLSIFCLIPSRLIQCGQRGAGISAGIYVHSRFLQQRQGLRSTCVRSSRSIPRRQASRAVSVP